MVETKAPYSLFNSGVFLSVFLVVFVTLPEMQMSGGRGTWRTMLGIRSGSWTLGCLKILRRNFL
jgi:hypothetical protein